MAVGSDSLAVEARGLSKRYGRTTALDGLDLEVRRGEVFALLGANGAGKTTAVKILLGLTLPDLRRTGRRVLGTAGVRARPAARVGYQPELFRYQGWLSGVEVLRLHAGWQIPTKSRRDEDIASVLATADLSARADDRVSTYSKGDAAAPPAWPSARSRAAKSWSSWMSRQRPSTRWAATS